MPRISSGDRIAVTGANGFVGQHVQAELAASGYRVIGIGRDEHPLAPDSLDDYVCADLTTAWPAMPSWAVGEGVKRRSRSPCFAVNSQSARTATQYVAWLTRPVPTAGSTR